MAEKKLEVLMQSKNLVETSYNITAIQNRVFYHCLFTAQKEKSGELSCAVKFEDIKKLIPNPAQRTLANVKKIFKTFRSTALLFNKDDDGDLIECDYNLIAGFEYNTTKQEFKVFFMERLYKHILEYTNYAPLNLEVMARFQSFYTQRLYEALRMWSRTDRLIVHTFSIETLRFIMCVGDKYPEYKNFKQRVLNQALKEINAIGNMEVEIEEKKEGKRVTKITFSILDHEPRKYFSDDKKSVKEVALEEQGEVSEQEKINYVLLPDDGFFAPTIRKSFIDYCYDEKIDFDGNIGDIYKEAQEIFRINKLKDNIDNYNDYKYFRGIFDNKLTDDVRRFAKLLGCV